MWELKQGRNNLQHPPLPPGKGMLITCQAPCPCDTEAFNPRAQRGTGTVRIASEERMLQSFFVHKLHIITIILILMVAT